MYMHITPQDGSSSTKKKDKDLAFKKEKNHDELKEENKKLKLEKTSQD